MDCVRRTLILTLSAILANAQENPPAKLDALIETIRAEVHPQDAMTRMRRIYATDRWFTFPKFQETAQYLKQALTDAGLERVEILGAPADGVTQAGFWTLPLAWDVKHATLEIVEPSVAADQAVLADYEKVPTSLGMWSGPTPANGITAEVVELRDGADLRGKLVLTSVNPANIKSMLVKAGALGAINAFTENPGLQDGRQWINAWGDDGWAFLKNSTPLLSFSITPRQAAFLRGLLRQKGVVRAKAVVDTRYYTGTYPYVTAVIPGASSEEEVLTLGHSSEQGAQDNATGVSAMLESVATLQRLIAAGKLPRPQRTIRIFLMGEMYGALHYISTHREQFQHTVAAMCLDTPASSYELPGTEYTFYMNPEAGAAYTDAFIGKLAAAYFSKVGRPWHTKPFTPGTDSYLGEPSVGVPTTWGYSGTGVETHHNSEDTPDRVDARSLRDITVVDAAFLYFFASAGEPEAKWLAGITADYWRARAKNQPPARLDYLAGRERQAVSSVLRLAPAKPVPGQDFVVRRKRIGTIPLDDMPQDQREGYPSGAWDTAAATALYWCDGVRTVSEVKRLTELEVGPLKFDLAGYFRFLARHGYVEIVKYPSLSPRSRGCDQTTSSK